MTSIDLHWALYGTQYHDIIDLDDATGMPVIPAGHWWKVRHNRTLDMIEVQLKKRTYGLPETVAYNFVSDKIKNPTQDDVVNTAALVAARYKIEYDKENHFNNVVKPLLGNYPPKKMGL